MLIGKNVEVHTNGSMKSRNDQWMLRTLAFDSCSPAIKSILNRLEKLTIDLRKTTWSKSANTWTPSESTRSLLRNLTTYRLTLACPCRFALHSHKLAFIRIKSPDPKFDPQATSLLDPNFPSTTLAKVAAPQRRDDCVTRCERDSIIRTPRHRLAVFRL